MGHFLAVTAIKTGSVDDAVAGLTRYMEAHALPCEWVREDSVNERRDAQVYAPVGGWTVILWPPYFNVHDFPLAREVAAARGWLVSTVHVYDDEYWEHLACAGTKELHAFCSRPTFWEDESPDDYDRMQAYEADPAALAAAAGVSEASLRPYLIDVDRLDDPHAKANAEDEFELPNFWVFTDFWKRLGITYPNPPHGLAGVLRLAVNFGRKLPQG